MIQLYDRHFCTLSVVLISTISLAASGCKNATLDPPLTGHVEGQVLDYDTLEPIAVASITTTPPSEALLTDEDGFFRIADLEVGNYQISARRSEYTPTTVSISVREDRTRTATIHLERKEESGASAAVLEVDVITWWSSTSADSTFAEAEYRVRNAGPVDAGRYAVYFHISTDGGGFMQEVTGDTLHVSQSHMRRFRTYILDRNAIDVEVESLWAEPVSD